MTPATLLLRQIHPSFIQAGRVTSQAFRPTPKDENHLSVYDGDKILPEAAWKHFTDTPGYCSKGVLAVSVAECGAEQLTVHPDGVPFPEHVSINFSAFGKKDIERKAKALASGAQLRGWLYRAEMV